MQAIFFSKEAYTAILLILNNNKSTEGVICRLQVAGQNLEKELNVLSGLRIFPNS